jgi:hypothetical protein
MGSVVHRVSMFRSAQPSGEVIGVNFAGYPPSFSSVLTAFDAVRVRPTRSRIAGQTGVGFDRYCGHRIMLLAFLVVRGIVVSGHA